jgi:hypothetical protein
MIEATVIKDPSYHIESDKLDSLMPTHFKSNFGEPENEQKRKTWFR